MYLGSKRILTKCLVQPSLQKEKQGNDNEKEEGEKETVKRKEEKTVGEPSHQVSTENSYNMMAQNSEEIIRYVVNNIAMCVILSQQMF